MKNPYLRILSLVFLVLLSGYISAQCTSSTTYLQATTCQSTPYSFNGMSLDSAGTYNDTIVLAGGCDSIISLQLFVIPTLYTEVYDTMCAGSYFVFYADTLRAAGTYTQTLYYGANFCDSIIRLHLVIGTGHNDTFRVSATYCSTGFGGGNGYYFYGRYLNQSGTYTHVAPLPGGNSCSDSVLILNLVVGGNNNGFPTAVSACGSSYNFYGRTLTTNGTYRDTLTSSLGCDSIITINLTLNAAYYQPPATNATLCAGGSYTWRGVTYTQPSPGGGPGGGGYKDTVVGTGGCDTIYTLILRNGFAPRVTVRDSFCAGSSYTYRGSTFTTSGRDTVYAPASTGGCDTMFILILSYKAAPTFTYVDSFCQGGSYTYRGHTYTTSGLHFFTVPAPTGCDSIIQVSLSYLTAPTINITDSFCQGTSYTYRGNTFTTSGLHSLTYPSPSGCDTVVNLNLRYTVAPGGFITATICQGSWYVHGPDSFNTRGFHRFTISTPGQCDSIFTLNLNVTPAPRGFVRDSFCQGGSYTYDGHTFTTAGRDTVYAPSPAGCDSMIILNLTYKVPAATPVITQTANVLVVNPLVANIQWYLNGTAIPGATAQTLIATQSGIYSVTTQATGGCTATSANDTVVGVGIEEAVNDLFRIYPNPSNGKFTIETSQYSGTEIMIFDVLGRAVFQKQLMSNKESIDMSGATNGTYYLVMKSQQSTRYAHFVIAQ